MKLFDIPSRLFDTSLRRFSDHDVEADVLLLALQINFLDDLKPELAVDDWIDVVRALQIASSTFGIKLNPSRQRLSSEKFDHWPTLSVTCSISCLACPFPLLSGFVPI